MSTKNRLFIPGYKRLEYIEGTGTQYIDTGFILDGNSAAELDLTMSAIEAKIMFGAREASTSNTFTFNIGGTGNKLLSGYNDGNKESDIRPNTTTRYLIKRDKGKFYANGELKDTASDATFSTGYTAYLFACNQKGSVYLPSSFKAYSLKIWDTGTLVRDYIPVQRISDNAIGMYDTVNKQFYGNSGTGSFTAGPQLQQVEYISSNGYKYIDTGISQANLTGYTLETTIRLPALPSGTRYLEGRYVANHGEYYLYCNNNVFQTAFGCSYKNTTKTVDTLKHTFRLERTNSQTTVKCDDETVFTSTEVVTGGEGNILLCGTYANTGFTVEYYEKRIWKDSVLARDLVPVLVGTEYAMFDLVTNTVYRNAGTGVFSGGPLIPDPAFMPFTSMRISRYANATSADTTKYPQTLNGYKKVDLGTLSWIYQTDGTYPVFRTTINGPFVSSGKAPIFATNYPVYPNVVTATFLKTNLLDGVIAYQASSATNQLMVQDSRYTSAADFKSAMSGVPLLYQLATSDGSVWNFTCDTATKTKNLVDFNETRINNNTWATADKTKGFEIVADIYGKVIGNSLGTNGNCFGVFAPCKKGESVSLNFFNYEPYYGRCFYCEVDTNFKVLTTPVQYSNGTSSLTQKTFTATNDNCIGFAIEWYINAAQTRNYTKENYMVVSGTTTPTAYEPYGNIFGYRNQSTGEFVKALGATGTITSYNKIDFLSAIFKKSKNLFNEINDNFVGGSLSDDGAFSAGTSSTTVKFPIEKNTSYTLSFIKQRHNYYDRICEYNDNDGFTSLLAKIDNRDKDIGETITITFTTTSNASYIRMYLPSYFLYNDIILEHSKSLQIEKGSTVTPYEPFGYKLIKFTNDYYKA